MESIPENSNPAAPEVPASAPRGGGYRGRGRSGPRGRRGRGGGGRGGQKPQTPPPPPAPAGGDPFAPRGKGGNPAIPKDDPAADSAIMIDGIAGFVEKTKNQLFQLDLSQYITLVTESYIAQTTCDRGLAKFVSASAYQYYMVILLWRRLFQLTSARRGDSCFDELSRALPHSLPVPKDIKIYLDSLGNIKDGEGQDWVFDFIADFSDIKVFGISGSYGKISTENHLQYETVPCPVIPLLTMRADILRTKFAGTRSWSLPTALTPADVEDTSPGLPTLDLLGYQKAKNLTDDQYNVLIGNGVDVSGPAEDETFFNARMVANVPVIQSLMGFLVGQFESTKCPMERYDTTAITGSLAQVPFTVRSSFSFSPNERISQKVGITQTYRQSPPYVACASMMFRFRIMRAKKSGIQTDGFCFPWWNETKKKYIIPPEWIANANDIFNKPEKWNISDFTAGTADGQALLSDLARKTKKKQE